MKRYEVSRTWIWGASAPRPQKSVIELDEVETPPNGAVEVPYDTPLHGWEDLPREPIPTGDSDLPLWRP